MLAAVTTEVIPGISPFAQAGLPQCGPHRLAYYDADRKSENRSDGEAMSKDNVVVGFVGLGTMGGRMAANVLAECSEEAQRCLRPERCAHAGRARERRPSWCSIPQACNLGRRGRKRLRPTQGRARRDRR